MKSVGIIPAAGMAQRFGGVLKELLPAKDGNAFINHAINQLNFCDVVVIVTNKEKIHSHINSVKGKNILFIEQKNNNDLLGALQSAMIVDLDEYFMIMPDTITDGSIFDNCPVKTNLSLGLFTTNKLGRFGYLECGKVRDKSYNINLPAVAWGALRWSAKVKNLFFLNNKLPDVLNFIMSDSFETWQIGNYYDIANVDEYIEYITAC